MGIEWTPRLAVGVESIDAQHRELFARVNKLMGAMEARRSEAEVKELASFLSEYVVTHFGAEEQLMALHSYPEEAAHRRLHAEFVNYLGAFHAELETRKASGLLAIELNHRVCSWLIEHIGATDRAFGAFLQRQKAQGAASR